jgi:hypothetical protein
MAKEGMRTFEPDFDIVGIQLELGVGSAPVSPSLSVQI